MKKLLIVSYVLILAVSAFLYFEVRTLKSEVEDRQNEISSLESEIIDLHFNQSDFEDKLLEISEQNESMAEDIDDIKGGY